MVVLEIGSDLTKTFHHVAGQGMLQVGVEECCLQDDGGTAGASIIANINPQSSYHNY